MKSTTVTAVGLALLVSFALAAGGWPPVALGADTASASRPSAAEGPSQVVRSVAQAFLADLNTHRAEYHKDPQLLRKAVDRDVLPYFDVQFAARLVLARYWRTATPAQREQFVSAFEDSVFANYGSALLSFQANHFQVLPTHAPPEATQAFVRTVIHRDDGSTVQVNFALHKTAEGWKAWDVIIEGISYVKSFRDDFGAQIEQQGLDSVIQRLRRGEKPPAIGGAAAKRS
jgi:phospholipid transport system substrate-binding protein